MPDQLDWNEDNLRSVMESIYAEAARDKSFHDKFMADPYEALNQRIKVPDEYKDKIFANLKNARRLVINMPPHEEMSANAPSATPADYEVLCTTIPPW